MLRENIQSLFLLYLKPVVAASRIIDEGRLLFALFAAIATSVLLHVPEFTAASRSGAAVERREARPVSPLPGDAEDAEPPAAPPRFAAGPLAARAASRLISYEPLSLFAALWVIAIVFVPAVILLRVVFAPSGSFTVVLRSDYLPLLMCVLMCWAAAYLPLAAGGALVGWGRALRSPALYALSNLYFLVLAVCSVRTLFGTAFAPAAGLTALAWAIALVATALFSIAGPSLYYLASPFYLYYAYMLFGSDVRAIGDGLRSRQSLRRQLEIATTNPRDADAHYQLGLIYQKRRQYTEAIACFERALKIDASEADAHYQLGRIAREQGRFEDAIRHCRDAARLDDKLSSNEVWRELGGACFEASRIEEAQVALEKYTARRPYDPEGLYWYGKTLIRLERAAEARDLFEQCLEAVRTMPPHRRAEVRQWGRAAETELRALRKRE